jgi:hypothetical protein
VGASGVAAPTLHPPAATAVIGGKPVAQAATNSHISNTATEIEDGVEKVVEAATVEGVQNGVASGVKIGIAKLGLTPSEATSDSNPFLPNGTTSGVSINSPLPVGQSGIEEEEAQNNVTVVIEPKVVTHEIAGAAPAGAATTAAAGAATTAAGATTAAPAATTAAAR